MSKILKALKHPIASLRSFSYKTIDDPALIWFDFAIPGMLHRGNTYCFDYAIRNLKSNSPIVEIGSFCGLSTIVMSYLKEKHGVSNTIITSDAWIFEGADIDSNLPNTNISHNAYREFVKKTYERNIQMFTPENLPWTFEVLSDEFFELWDSGNAAIDIFNRKRKLGGPISFCYIDGNHSYEFAKRDFENCDKFLEAGGFILFDDSSDGSNWGVCQVVREALKRDDYNLVIKNPNYLIQKIN
jgi:hypothetical protein